MDDDRIAEYVEPKEEPTPRLLRQMVVQNRNLADSGHRRHSDRLRLAEDRLLSIENKAASHDIKHAQFEELFKRPVEATAIRFDAKLVMAICAICVSIVGGQRWAASDLKEQIAAGSTETKLINAKIDAMKQHNDDEMKLQESTNATVQRELTRIGGQVTMIDTKLNNLMIRR